MKIKNLIICSLLSIFATSCIHQDLSKTLRYSYAEGEKLGVSNIDFQELETMKRGEACLYRVLYLIPVGDDSIITATANGGIGSVKYIGETGFWGIPFSQSCTVVYGS